MQPITKEELLDYLRDYLDSELPTNWTQIEKIIDSNVMKNLELTIAYFLFCGCSADPEDVIKSILFTGFQMGRHFEQRKAEIAELNSLCQNKP